jgi:hypothetical protein
MPAADDAAQALLTTFIETWNSRDVARIVDLFAETAVLTTPPFPGLPSSFRGKEEIRQAVELYIPGFQATLTGAQRHGDRLHFTARVSADALRQLGVETVDEENDLVVGGDGKVTSFTVGYTAESQAVLERAFQQGGASSMS